MLRAGHLFQRGAHGLLHGMAGLHIADRVLVEAAGEADETGMLAGAVVVERGRLEPGLGDGAGGSLVHRPMRAAFEAIWRRALPSEHAEGGLGMVRLAGMRGDGERDLGLGQAVMVGGAALQQRQGLDRLHRRARKDRAVDIAEREHHAAIGIDDDHGTAMARSRPYCRASPRRERGCP